MKRFLVVFFTFTLLMSNTFAATASASKNDIDSTWPEGPNPGNISADSAIIMELSTGLILYEKNIHKRHFPASITKIMTTLLALESCSLGETVTFSHDAIFGIESGSSHIGIDVGEELTVEQSMYGIMLESANEVSLGIAEHVAGSSSAFADMMNAKAKELGCLDTHFVNPNGLHDDDHYTSAYDMALISRTAFQNSTFKKLTGTKHYVIPPTNIQEETRYLRNHHQMLNPYNYPCYEYDYCVGGKTGYTSDSKWTLVTFAEKDGMELICVVMRALGPTSEHNEYSDTIDLFNFCFENYVKYPVGNKLASYEIESPLFTRFNAFFDVKNSPLQVNGDTSVILPSSADVKDAVHSIDYISNAQLHEGVNVIGTVSYTYDGKLVGSSDITYNNTEGPHLVNSTPLEVLENKDANVLTESKQIDLKPIIIGALLLTIIIIIVLFSKHTSRMKRRSHFSYYRNRKEKKPNKDFKF